MTLSKKDVGQSVKEARKIKSKNIGKHYTQLMLAGDINKSQSYIGDIESGRIYPNYEILNTISTACGVPFSFFSDLSEKSKVFISYMCKQETGLNDDTSWSILNNLQEYMITVPKGIGKTHTLTTLLNELNSTTNPKILIVTPNEVFKTLTIFKSIYINDNPKDPNNIITETNLPYYLDAKYSYSGLLIKDDSMNLSKIAKNDIVIFKQQEEVENGDIAIVITSKDEEACIRRYYKSGEIVALIPNSTNPEYIPTLIDTTKDTVHIFGKVVKAIINF